LRRFTELKETAAIKFPSLVYYFTPRLRSVDIEPTNSCNLQCKMCCSRKRPRGFMSWNLFKKVVDELDSGFENLSLSLYVGGESLLHPRFIDMIKYARGKSCFCEIGFNTNGMLLTKEYMQDIVENIDWIKFSLEGLGEVNDSIRVGCDYLKVAQNIKDLVSLRGSKDKPRISINVTEYTQSKEDVSKFVEYWTKHVDAVYVSVFVDEKMRVSEKFFDNEPVIRQRFCIFPFTYMGIRWNGDVIACCGDLNGVNVVGSILNEPLKDIWRNKRFKALRYQSLTGKYLTQSLCSQCNMWKTSFKPSSSIIDGVNIRFYGQRKEYTRIEGFR